MSAEANSMGMFSNSETSDKLDLPRPVPIHTVPHKYAETIITDLTDFKKECPAYGKLYDQIHQTHSYKHALKLWNSKLPNFKEWSGYPKFNFHNLEHFFDSLQCAVAHDLQMPSWFNQKIFETIKSGAAVRHYLKFTDLDHEYQDQVARLTTGGLIKSIQTDFLEKKYKFKAYSAHDTNLVGIMAALGEYNFKVPGYASAFIFERYDDESVKWLFRNDTNVEGVYEMKLCVDKFELGCSLAEWRYETEELISKDWKKECGMGGLFDGEVREPGLTEADVPEVFQITLPGVEKFANNFRLMWISKKQDHIPTGQRWFKYLRSSGFSNDDSADMILDMK